MDTTTSAALYEGVRTHLLDYVPQGPLASQQTLRQSGHKVYADAPPDDAAYPYSIIRFMGMVTDTGGMRERGQLEVMTFARPRKVWAAKIKTYCDIIDQAMHLLTDARGGALVLSRVRSRDTLPPPPSPADREVVQERQVYGVTVYPQYLTALGTSFSPSTT